MRTPLLLALIATVVCFTGDVRSEEPPAQVFDLDQVQLGEAGEGLKSPKIDSALLQHWLLYADPGQAFASSLVPQTVRFFDGLAEVVVEAEPGAEAEVRQAIATAGGRVHLTYENELQALVPVPQLVPLANHPSVRFVRRPVYAEPLAVTSEGLNLIGVSSWHAAGYRGQGVTVAVIDLGFAGYESLLGTELPPSSRVTYGNFAVTRSTTEKHGTAVAEIIADIAPEARLLLLETHTVIEIIFAIEWAANQGAHILNLSLGTAEWGPGDGNSPIGGALEFARNKGSLAAVSAGNFGQHHWFGVWGLVRP